MVLELSNGSNHDFRDNVSSKVGNRWIICKNCNGSGKIINKYYQKCQEMNTLAKNFHKCDPNRCISCTIAKRCKLGTKITCSKCQGKGERKSTKYFSQLIRQRSFEKWRSEQEPSKETRTFDQQLEDFLGINQQKERI